MRYAHPAMLLLLTACDSVLGLAVSDDEWDATKTCAEARSQWCLDGDEDGYGGVDRVPPPEGICNDKSSSFSKGTGWDTGAGPYKYKEKFYYSACNDCNDKNRDINPGAQDCRDDGDGADNDCSGVVDDQEKQDPCYVDMDDDGSYTNVPACSSECKTDESLPDGADTDECDDGDATVYPGAEDQICADGLDSDCSGGSECAVVGSNVALSSASRKIEHVGSIAMREIDINSDGYGDLAVVRDASWSDTGDTDVMVLFGSETAMAQDSTSGEVSSPCGLTRDGNWAPQVAGHGDLVVLSDPSASVSVYLYQVDTSGNVNCGSTEDFWTSLTTTDDSGVSIFGARLAVGSNGLFALGRWCSTASTDSFAWYGYSFDSYGDSKVGYLISPYVFAKGGEGGDALDCAQEYLPAPSVQFAGLDSDRMSDDLLVRWTDYTWDSAKDDFDSQILERLDIVQDLELEGYLVDTDSSLYEGSSCSVEPSAGFAVSVVGCPGSQASGHSWDSEYTPPVDCIAMTTLVGDVSEVDIYAAESEACPGPVIRQAEGAEPLAILAPEGSTDFGISLSGAGDVNGDGYDDLLVGSAGAAYLYLRWEEPSGAIGYGTPYGPDGVPTTDYYARITIDGQSPTSSDPHYEVFGDADLNGDGYSDFGVLVAGTLYLFAGGPP